MSNTQLQEVADAVLPVITEEELARYRREDGARVIQHAGHYWEEVGAPGFFQPVNLLAPLTPEEATRPTPLSWGYRAALAPQDAGAANGSVPIVRLKDLASYDIGSLSPNRRNKLRKCWRLVRIEQLTSSELLVEQGHELVLEALARTGHRRPPSKEEFVTEVRRYLEGGYGCMLAGLVDGRLGGFLTGYAVDGVAYGLNAYYATWALPTNISTGLIFEFAQLCRRSGRVRTLVGGLHAPESPQLSQFKDDMGFVVDRIPSRWNMHALARAFIRWRRPHAYYRLTGQA
ncbi:hypothetical protein HPC49_08970 [Pyxidicoccus fallax]|uniref:BioF2-like acetyltransferase domain-containing protein n=1 Tax=Pyxidicoccus fallax TaxID=394095 RepID=A0A848LDS2_9BACT|nr:hypothetical protein [Pyxidicoccus fallax]NMO16596.1 hypothetical protein [Pyxidicoccus fallax]NPC78377.1 hypothetical protein [Pyxidicoccus fallax]